MPLLTVEQFRTHVKTTLADDAVQRILDANEAEIVRRFGAGSPVTETLYPLGHAYLFLSWPATAITSISETRDGVTTVLAANDYSHAAGSNILRRLDTGTNSYSTWDLVTIAYTVTDATAERRRVLIRVSQFDIENRPGVGSQSTADQSISYSSRLDDEREEIFRSLDAWRGPVFA